MNHELHMDVWVYTENKKQNTELREFPVLESVSLAIKTGSQNNIY